VKKTILPIGPFHPIQEEPECFQLHLDGERIVDMDVRIGYNHRGIEKLAETKTWHQVPFLVERVCGICSASHPLAYVQAVEDIAGVKPPPRALYLRTIVNELERVHSHLLWVGLAGHFIGYNTVFMWAWKYREPVMDLLEELTGSRINYANARVGGVARDIPNELLAKINGYLDVMDPAVDLFIGAVTDDPVIHARLKDVGILTKRDARDYAVTGPTARGAGIPIDVRRDDPYAAYDQLDWDVCAEEAGDVFAMAAVRLRELVECSKMLRQAVRKIPGGPVDVQVKAIPPGEAVGHVEAPRGETFHYVRSDGGACPVRHKIRAPSYVNVPSFKARAIGETISDAVLIIASVDPCYSCTERLAVVRAADGSVELTGEDLVRLSHQRTAEIRKQYGRTKLDELVARTGPAL